MKHERNKNQSKWNADRKKKTRTIVMTDEENDRLTKLSALREKSRSECVNQLVNEEARRVGLHNR